MRQNKFVKLPLLGGLLVAQVILALLLWAGTKEEPIEVVPLLSATQDAVDHIVFNSNEATIKFVKKDDEWFLDNGVPADDARLRDLFRDLFALKTGWPAASTESAHKRFKLVDDDFERKLELYAGDQLLDTLYLGSVIDVKKRYVRRAGDDNIYVSEVNQFNVAPDLSSWFNAYVIQPQEFTAVSHGDYLLEKADGEWPGMEDSADETSGDDPDAPKPYSVKRFIETLMKLRNLEMAEPGSLPGEPEGQVQFTVTTPKGEFKYEIFKQDERYWVKRNDYPQSFKIIEGVYEDLAAITRAQSGD